MRRSAVLFSLLVFCLTLFACGGGASKPEQDQADSPEEQVQASSESADEGEKGPEDAESPFAGYEEKRDAELTKIKATAAQLVGLSDGDLSSLKAMIHPERGLFVLTRPGAVEVLQRVYTVEELEQKATGIDGMFAQVSGQVSMEPHPTFDCESGFSKEGSFLADMADSSFIGDKMAQLESLEVQTFEADEKKAASEADDYTVYSMLMTGAALEARFMVVDGQFYLAALDLSSFECGA